MAVQKQMYFIWPGNLKRYQYNRLSKPRVNQVKANLEAPNLKQIFSLRQRRISGVCAQGK